MKTVSFTRMDQGTAHDYAYLAEVERQELGRFPDRVIGWLREMDEPTGYKISRLEHSLQAATRAERDGRDEPYVVMCLLHDVGDVVAPANHSEVAAAMLRPYVDDDLYWILKHHGLFQGYYYFHHHGGDPNARDRYRDHLLYDATVEFCAEYDQVSFDPAYDAESLDHFEPALRRVLAEPRALV